MANTVRAFSAMETFDLTSGVFTVPEAALLLRTDQQTVRRWFAGKKAIFAAPRWGTTVNLTFEDLVSALFIRAFRSRGFSLQLIRKIAANAADMLGTERPFALNRFCTDGKTILAEIRDHGSPSEKRMIDLGRGKGQFVFRALYADFIQDIEFGLDAKARCWWPLGKKAGVRVDPRVSMGAPVTRSGIPARLLASAAKAEKSTARVASWYGVKAAEVLAAKRFEERIHARAA